MDLADLLARSHRSRERALPVPRMADVARFAWMVTARSRGWARVAGWVAVVVAVLAGTAIVVTALTTSPEPPPRPGPAAAPRFGGPAVADANVPAAPAGAPSLPSRLRVDAIGVTASVQPVGVDADGGVHVPPSGQPGVVGWYSQGPTPGEAGNAVLVGHVDSRTDGPGVFFELGRLRPGDEVGVARADGSTAIFRVDGVRSYPKAAVPAELVFGEADRPGLRLITCGGDWDTARRTYEDNVVAFATLVAWSSRRNP